MVSFFFFFNVLKGLEWEWKWSWSEYTSGSSSVCVSIYKQRAKDRGVTEMGLREWERAVFER